jgi:hypothetical protein
VNNGSLSVCLSLRAVSCHSSPDASQPAKTGLPPRAPVSTKWCFSVFALALHSSIALRQGRGDARAFPPVRLLSSARPFRLKRSCCHSLRQCITRHAHMVHMGKRVCRFSKMLHMVGAPSMPRLDESYIAKALLCHRGGRRRAWGLMVVSCQRIRDASRPVNAHNHPPASTRWRFESFTTFGVVTWTGAAVITCAGIRRELLRRYTSCPLVHSPRDKLIASVQSETRVSIPSMCTVA